MAYSVFEIANWFLSKEAMTHKKLQKLVYYSEAWSNALLNRSMVEDDQFEAWAHGPVSEKLYQKYRQFGWQDIDESINFEVKNEKDLELLESVWETYGDMTANGLEAQTHSENPWKLARLRAGVEDGDPSNEIILKEDMRTYYLSIYAGE